MKRYIKRQVNNAQKIRKSLLGSASERTWERVTTNEIGKVILILSSSRSGSSLLYEILKQTSQLLSLSGEHVPFFKLNGFSFPFNQITSDLLDCETLLAGEDASSLSRDIITDIQIGPGLTKFNFQKFGVILALRLALQWSKICISADDWMTYIARTRQVLGECCDNWNATLFLLKLLKLLNEDGHHVNPYYYDVPSRLSSVI